MQCSIIDFYDFLSKLSEKTQFGVKATRHSYTWVPWIEQDYEWFMMKVGGDLSSALQ